MIPLEISTTTTTTTTTRRTSSSSSEEYVCEKEHEILSCLNGSNNNNNNNNNDDDVVDLWHLRQLALSQDGFINNTLRKRAWPKLVGIPHLTTNSNFQNNEKDCITSSSSSSSSQQERIPMDLIRNDIQRCVWNIHSSTIATTTTDDTNATAEQPPPLMDNHSNGNTTKTATETTTTTTTTTTKMTEVNTNDPTTSSLQPEPPATGTKIDEKCIEEQEGSTTTSLCSQSITTSSSGINHCTNLKTSSSLQNLHTPTITTTTDNNSSSNNTTERSYKSAPPPTTTTTTTTDTTTDTINHHHHHHHRNNKPKKKKKKKKKKSKSVSSGNSNQSNNGIKKKQSMSQQEALFQIITSVFTNINNNDDGRYHYYQGFHDLAALIFVTLESPSLTSLLLKQLSIKHLRDTMQSNFDNISYILQKCFKPLLRTIDNELHDFIYMEACIGSDSMFALSWIVCWFAHDISPTTTTTTDITNLSSSTTTLEANRLLDVLIASHMSMPIYICIAFLTHPIHRHHILYNTECDFVAVHVTLTQLTKLQHTTTNTHTSSSANNDNNNNNNNAVGRMQLLEEIIQLALSYMKKYPPSELSKRLQLVKERKKKEDEDHNNVHDEKVESDLNYSSTTTKDTFNAKQMTKNHGADHNNNNHNTILCISMLDPQLPDWSMADTAPTDMTLIQQQRTNHNNNNSSSDATASSSTTFQKNVAKMNQSTTAGGNGNMLLPPPPPPPMADFPEKYNLAWIASGWGYEMREERRRRKKKKKLIISAAMAMIAGTCLTTTIGGFITKQNTASTNTFHEGVATIMNITNNILRPPNIIDSDKSKQTKNKIERNHDKDEQQQNQFENKRPSVKDTDESTLKSKQKSKNKKMNDDGHRQKHDNKNNVKNHLSKSRTDNIVQQEGDNGKNHLQDIEKSSSTPYDNQIIHDDDARRETGKTRAQEKNQTSNDYNKRDKDRKNAMKLENNKKSYLIRKFMNRSGYILQKTLIYNEAEDILL